MANKVTIYLDIMRGNSFVKQIPYLRSGFLTKIDGNPEQILDAHEVEEMCIQNYLTCEDRT